MALPFPTWLDGLLFDWQVSKARRARRCGQFNVALRHYQNALWLRADATSVWVQLGHVQKHLKLYAEAASSYATALKLGSKDEVARRFVLSPKEAQATSLPPRASGSSPQTSTDRRACGDAANAAQRWEEARDEYAAYLQDQPNDFAIWVQHGHMCKELGDLKASERSYMQALRLNPQDPDLTLQLGHLMARLGEHRSAMSFYKRALALDPSLSGAHVISDRIREQQTWR